MSSLVSKLWTKLYAKKKPLAIMIVGLDNSGKTSILNSLVSPSNSPPASSRFQTKDENKAKDGNQLIGHDADEISHPLRTFDDQLPATQALLASSSTRKEQKHRLTPSSGIKNDNGTRADTTMPTVGYNYEMIQFKSLSVTMLDFSGQNRYRNLWQEFYNGVDGVIFVIDSSDLIRLVVARDELENLLSHPFFSTLINQAAMSSTTASNHGHSQATLPTMRMSNNPMWTQKQLNISQGKLIQAPLETSSISTSSTSSSGVKVRLRTKIPILFLANKSDLPNSADTETISKALNLRQLPIDRHPWHIQASSVTLNQGIVEGFDWLIGQLTVS